MAGRGRPLGSKHDEKTRLKIQTSQLINRLQNHIFKEAEMTATQLRAAEILLNKTLPNLQAIEQKTEITERYAIAAEPMDSDSFEDAYNLGAAKRATESIN